MQIKELAERAGVTVKAVRYATARYRVLGLPTLLSSTRVSCKVLSR